MAEFEPILGRYLKTTIDCQKLRIFIEEAGQGIPIVCLHTAGSDSRQYRHMFCDTELTKRFRIIAFDLPWHGRSLPPDGWWTSEYLLTTDTYISWVMAVIEELELERPIIVGCSMAGSLTLEMARRFGSRLGGVIGLSGALKVNKRFYDWPLFSDVNAQQTVASWVNSLMAPQSPEAARREVWWTYAQGGPGIYRGDTYFYSEDFDLTDKVHEIDTRKCSVCLLTGEYDYACSAQETEEALRSIPGSTGGTMKGIGHFPVAENYSLFREHLIPALDAITQNRE